MDLKTHKAAMRANFKEEIISAASEVFANHGLEDFSLRNLARKMGCSVGTLYLYFDDKQTLLHEVVEQSFRELLKALESIPPTRDPLEIIRAAFTAYVDFGLKYPSHYRCAFAILGTANSKNHRPHEAFQFLRNRVSRGVEAGLFVSDDVDVICQIIWASVHGLTSLLISRPDFSWAPKKKLIDLLSEVVITGLLKAEIKNGRIIKAHQRLPKKNRGRK